MRLTGPYVLVKIDQSCSPPRMQLSQTQTTASGTTPGPDPQQTRWPGRSAGRSLMPF